MTIEERISVVETKVASNEKLLQKNSDEHKQILDRINELEISLLVYRRIVYFAAAMIGGAIGLIFKYWDFIIHRLGH
jgi:hypothetical protein